MRKLPLHSFELHHPEIVLNPDANCPYGMIYVKGFDDYRLLDKNMELHVNKRKIKSSHVKKVICIAKQKM